VEIYLAALVPWMVILQYLPSYVDSLQTRSVIEFRYANIDNGLFTYVKDAAFLIWGVSWPILFTCSSNRKRRQYTTTLLLFELFVAVIGSVGHAINYSDNLAILAACRLFLWFHGSIGAFLLASFCTPGNLKFLLTSCVLSSVVGAMAGIVQWQICHVGTTLRFPSLFGNAITFGASVAGGSILLHLLCTRRTRRGSHDIYWAAILAIILLAGTICSGTRSGFVVSLIFFTSTILQLLKKVTHLNIRREQAIIFSTAFLFLGLSGAVLLANYFSNRGDVILQNLDPRQAGRLSIGTSILERWSASDTIFLFGRGLGTGSNTHIGLAENLHDIADNFLVSMLVQFGLVGVALLAVYTTIVFQRLIYKLALGGMTSVLVLLSTAVFAFTGNIVEIIPLFYFLAIAMGSISSLNHNANLQKGLPSGTSRIVQHAL
jgi:hypothetical protein